MPHRRLPMSLYKMCRNVLHHMLSSASKEIATLYGSYEEIQARHCISQIHTLLESELSTVVLTDVLDHSAIQQSETSLLSLSCDIRIYAALLLHPKRFQFVVNHCSELYKIETSFWEHHLAGMSGIVSLNLTLICTDNLLKVVSVSCPLLERIRVVSKTSANRWTANALKKIYWLSDVGMMYLCKCKRLRVISVGTCLGNIKGSCFGVVLKRLPNLEALDYDHLGDILSRIDVTTPLNLKFIVDMCSAADNVCRMRKYCPQLVVVHLGLPLVCEQHAQKSSGILQELCQMTQELSTLTLENILVTAKDFHDLLNNFGAHLKELHIAGIPEAFDANALCLIGEACPLLEKLRLQNMKSSKKFAYHGPLVVGKMFEKLKEVYLFGNFWDAESALKVCFSGNQLAVIWIVGSTYVCLDRLFEKMLAKGSLQHLQSLGLCKEAFLSLNLVWELIHSMADLQYIYCYDPSGESRQALPSINKFLEKNRLDLIVTFEAN